MRTSETETSPAGLGRLLRLRLRFRDPELERQFILTYRTSARLWVRVSLVVALSSVLGFAIIDHLLLVGPRLAKPDIWRFGLQLPLVLIMLVLTAPRLYLRWYQPAIQMAAPLFGVGTVLMAVEATPAQLPLVAARLLLAAFYFYFMIGLTFGAAVRTNLLLIAAYASAALLGLIAPTVATYSLFVLFSANLIGGAGCYALEYANRVAFLERRRLAEVAMHDGLTGAAQPRRPGGPGEEPVAARPGRAPAGFRAADRHRPLQALQRPLRTPGRRPLPAGGRHGDQQRRTTPAAGHGGALRR